MRKWLIGSVIGLIYLLLVMSDFWYRPELVWVPVSLALSGLVMLGLPMALRKFLVRENLSLAASLLLALVLVAATGFGLYAAIPESLVTYEIIVLVSLNAVFLLLAVSILRMEREQIDV